MFYRHTKTIEDFNRVIKQVFDILFIDRKQAQNDSKLLRRIYNN